jgi:hypothetical protein
MAANPFDRVMDFDIYYEREGHRRSIPLQPTIESAGDELL